MKSYNIVCLVLCFVLTLANSIYIDIEEEYDDAIMPAMLIIEEEYDDAIIPAMLIKPATLINRNVGAIWKNCTKSDDDAEILKVSITPDPPKKGQKITVTVLYNLKTNITSGTVNLHGKIDGIIPINRSIDLCTLEKCPIEAANNKTISISQDIPNVGGHFTATVTLNDQNNHEIACITIDVRL